MIELTNNEVEILGRPNFACAQIAKILIKSGEYKKGPEKAEYEQAAYIHWASNLLKEYGNGWKSAANEQLKELLSKITKNEKQTR